MSAFLEKNRGVLLLYDQGLEHGPTDFNERNSDPESVMRLAVNGKFNGIVFQNGLAEKYYDGGASLILKLKGRTNLSKGEPIARKNCSVKHGAELGAKAVGYTIYPGSAMMECYDEGRTLEEAVQA
jgi:class I fructose-bisphosphate aldolase